MRLRKPLRLVANPIAWFLGCTLVLAGSAGWFAWRFIEVDRQLEDQRIQERLETAADGIISTLSVSLGRTEDALRDLLRDTADAGSLSAAVAEVASTEDSAVLLLRSNSVQALPRSRLAYYPASPDDQATTRAKVFASGERLEFIRHDYAAAIVAYESLVHDADSALRAGAHLRIGRVHRKAGNPTKALIAYQALSTFDSDSIEEVPAGLLGQLAACRLFAELGEDAADAPLGAAAAAQRHNSGRPLFRRGSVGAAQSARRATTGSTRVARAAGTAAAAAATPRRTTELTSSVTGSLGPMP